MVVSVQLVSNNNQYRFMKVTKEQEEKLNAIIDNVMAQKDSLELVCLAYVVLSTAERLCRQFQKRLEEELGTAERTKKKVLKNELVACKNLIVQLTKAHTEGLLMTDNIVKSDEDINKDSWYLVKLLNMWGHMNEEDRASLLEHATKLGELNPMFSSELMEDMKPKDSVD